MTRTLALDGQERRGGSGGQPPIRLAVLDSDTGFLQVLSKRLDGAGWQYRVLASPVPLDAMVAMRLNALVIDLAVLGPQGWNYLEKLCARMPGLGVIVCTGPSSVAQRVRGLRMGADDWITKPCHPEELIARVEAVVRRRKRAEARADAGPLVVGEVEHDCVQTHRDHRVERHRRGEHAVGPTRALESLAQDLQEARVRVQDRKPNRRLPPGTPTTLLPVQGECPCHVSSSIRWPGDSVCPERPRR